MPSLLYYEYRCDADGCTSSACDAPSTVYLDPRFEIRRPNKPATWSACDGRIYCPRHKVTVLVEPSR